MERFPLAFVLIVVLTSTIVVSCFHSVEAQQFSLSAAPSSLTVTAGQSATYAVTIASVGGWAGDVQLSVTGSPALPPGHFFTPPTVRVSSGGQAVSTLSIPSDAQSKPLYELTITGTSGSSVRTARTQLIVVASSATIQTMVTPSTNIFLQLAPEWVWISLILIAVVLGGSWIILRLREAK